MSEIIKSGSLFKFSDTVFNSKWKYNHVELLNNSTMRWFEKKDDKIPKRSVLLKDVSSFLAFGDITKQLPFKPHVKEEQIPLLIAIPHENRRETRLSFFLCNNQTEMQEWINAILSTISDQNSLHQPLGSTNIPGGQPSYPQNSQRNITTAVPSNAIQNPHGPPPPYSGFQQSGPPPIGFMAGSQPPAPYQNPPRPEHNLYPQNVVRPSYQAGVSRPYPTQTTVYAAPGGQSYYPGNVHGQQGPPSQTYVYVNADNNRRNGAWQSAALGFAAGATGAYMTHSLLHGYGHHWGGGWGWGDYPCYDSGWGYSHCYDDGWYDGGCYDYGDSWSDCYDY